jgi:hypothetical protein
MSIQNIINRAQQIEIDRRRMVGQSISRSQRIKTAERSTGQPWKFKVTPPAQLPWTASRGFIEVIDFNDRVNEYTISLNDNPGMNYITAYQGELSQIQLDALTISTSTTSTLVLTTLPTTASTSVLFKPGDIIQPENSRYPYSVTTTVLRGSGSTVSVPLNRAIITSEGVNLMTQGVKVGNSATWQVVVTGLPTYSLIPMRQVQYTGDFELIEKII